MSSRPLLTSVALLTVMTGPMVQVGWASACSGVTSASSALLRWRKGPPLAVTISRATSPARPPRRHCAIAECSESTGTIWPGAAMPATSGPPMISDSLLASASTRPARSAARVAASPTAPVTALSTTSQGRAARSATASGPAMTSGSLRRAPSAEPGRGEGSADVSHRCRAGDGHDLGAELDRLSGQQLRVCRRRQRCPVSRKRPGCG